MRYLFLACFIFIYIYILYIAISTPVWLDNYFVSQILAYFFSICRVKRTARQLFADDVILVLLRFLYIAGKKNGEITLNHTLMLFFSYKIYLMILYPYVIRFADFSNIWQICVFKASKNRHAIHNLVFCITAALFTYALRTYISIFHDRM